MSSTGEKVLVCGGREYDDPIRMREVLHQHDIKFLVNGGARGADKLASEWAQDLGIPFATYPALWKALGTSAGPARNRYMLKDSGATLIIAFPGGAGTASMIREGQRKGIKVIEVAP